MPLARRLLLAAAASAALAATPVAAGHISVFKATLTPLNNSGVSGNARFVHDSNAGTLSVRVRASGLVPNTLHPQHIHGLFADTGCTNRAPVSSSSPVSGACLDSSTAIESNIPTLANDDFDGDGFLETVEGAPAYGPILLNFAPPGTTPDQLPGAFPMSDADGNLFFEATYDLAAEEMGGLLFDTLNMVGHEVEDLFPLISRVFVLHGTTAGPGGGQFEVTEGTAPGEFVALLPAAAGEIEVPEPAALGLLGMGLLGLGMARRRRKA